jgi:hypothetical protein
MNGNQNHILVPVKDESGEHYSCKGCNFETDNLSDVAQHVVENQFVVSNVK